MTAFTALSILIGAGKGCKSQRQLPISPHLLSSASSQRNAGDSWQRVCAREGAPYTTVWKAWSQGAPAGRGLPAQEVDGLRLPLPPASPQAQPFSPTVMEQVFHYGKSTHKRTSPGWQTGHSYLSGWH